MKIDVLDHGYVEFIEAWGAGSWERYPDGPGRVDHEVGIIEAARQSTQGSFRGWEAAACDCTWKDDAARTAGELADQMDGHYDDCASKKSPGDARLLSYLYNNKHMTPFEFAGMVIEVQAPIFVFREWHRHRTQSYNEMSARYAPLPDLNYLPITTEVYMRAEKAASTTNRQASGTGRVPTADQIAIWLQAQEDLYENIESHYRVGLELGVPKELARLVLPVGRYSKMRASANLRNWLAFMTLRCDPAAQWEIRQYALAVAKIVEEKFPQTYKLWSR